MIFRLLFLLAIIPVLIACSKKDTTNPTAVTVEDLLLKDNEISGWRKAGNGWVASNENELFSHIDGSAPLYTKNGFVEAASQDYQGSILANQTTIMLEIYNQRASANAKAVFDEVVQQLSNAETWKASTLTDARIERFELSQNIVCWKSN